MLAAAHEIERLIGLVRQSFQRLKRVGDGLHADLGINASSRAILEDITLNGERTVPQIAASKEVSRQHIQKIVDALIDLGCVTAKPNPDHQRSPFIALTAAGKRKFAEARKREAVVLAKLAMSLKASNVSDGCRALQSLLQSLEPFSKGESNERNSE